MRPPKILPSSGYVKTFRKCVITSYKFNLQPQNVFWHSLGYARTRSTPRPRDTSRTSRRCSAPHPTYTAGCASSPPTPLPPGGTPQRQTTIHLSSHCLGMTRPTPQPRFTLSIPVPPPSVHHNPRRLTAGRGGRRSGVRASRGGRPGEGRGRGGRATRAGGRG